MSKIIYITSSILLIISCFACNSGKFTKRYQKITVSETTTPEKFVKIEGFCIDFNQLSSDKSIFDLSDRGQSTLVNELSKKSKNNTETYEQLSKKFTEKENQTTEYSNTKFKKRIIISAENLQNENGANRIENFSVRLKIPTENQNNIKFSYWDKIVTERQEVDLGKLTYSKTGSFSISPEITMSGTIQGSAPFSGSLSNTTGEEVSLKKKFSSITGTISNNELRVTRNSAPLEDINGNIIIEVTITVTNTGEKFFYDIDSLFVNGKPNLGIGIPHIRKKIYRFPNINIDDSKVSLEYDFKYRAVNRGAKTFTESDDDISLIIGKNVTSSTITLLNEDDLRKNFWIIKSGNNILSLKYPNSQMNETIRFDSFDKAEAFLQWIIASKLTRIGLIEITLGQALITLPDISKLRVEIE